MSTEIHNSQNVVTGSGAIFIKMVCFNSVIHQTKEAALGLSINTLVDEIQYIIFGTAMHILFSLFSIPLFSQRD